MRSSYIFKLQGEQCDRKKIANSRECFLIWWIISLIHSIYNLITWFRSQEIEHVVFWHILKLFHFKNQLLRTLPNYALRTIAFIVNVHHFLLEVSLLLKHNSNTLLLNMSPFFLSMMNSNLNLYIHIKYGNIQQCHIS